MKKAIYILIAMAFMSCKKEQGESIPKPITYSEYIIGKWEHKVGESGPEAYYLTFRGSTYSVEYFDGDTTLKSDSPIYSLNDDTGEIVLVRAMIRDYANSRIYYFDWPPCFIEMTNDNAMTWMDNIGRIYILKRVIN